MKSAFGLAFLLLAGCAAINQPTTAPTSGATGGSLAPTAPTTEPAPGSLAWWQQNTAGIGHVGQLKDDVYTITIPRDDLWVQSEMGDIPTAAGIESRFNFFRCTCGHGLVVGEFCVADYEANDVIDALRAGAIIRVSSVGPMFLGTKPPVMIVRFQGEGQVAQLAGLIKSALEWVGPARSATQPTQ